MTFPRSLVNPLRFDKVARVEVANQPASFRNQFSAAAGGDFARPPLSRSTNAAGVIGGRYRACEASQSPSPRLPGIRWTGIIRGTLCIAQEGVAVTLKTSNLAPFRKLFLIIWKPRSPNLIPRVCPAWG